MSISWPGAKANGFFVGASGAIFGFRGTKLHPRDPQLTAALKEALPVITRQTTMWKAWIGFNASHIAASA